MADDPKLPRYNPTVSSGQSNMAHDRFGHDPGQVPMGEGRVNRRKVAIILGAVLAVLVAVVVGVAIATGGEPENVDEVADAAQEVAEDLDVDDAVDLLCEPPTDDQLERVEEAIERGKEEAGTDDPDLNVAIANEEGDREGSFDLVVTSDDGDLAGYEGTASFTVEQDGDRSCISDIDISSEGLAP